MAEVNPLTGHSCDVMPTDISALVHHFNLASVSNEINCDPYIVVLHLAEEGTNPINNRQ